MAKQQRWITLLTAVGGAAIGMAGAGLVGVRINDPAVQGAVVGAVAGVVGGTLGAGITAWTTRETTTATLSEARASREGSELAAHESRDDAQQTLFADRVRELSAQLRSASDRFATAAAQLESRRKWDKESLGFADPQLDHSFGQAVQELRLLVRLPSTYAAIDHIARAIHRVENSMSGWFAIADDFDAAAAGYLAAAEAFEDAIRVELGRLPIERPLRLPPFLPLAVPAVPASQAAQPSEGAGATAQD